MTQHRPIVVDEVGASDIIGVSRSSLQKMRVYGNGPIFVKIGNRVRYRVSDLEKFLADRVVSSTSEVV